MPQLTLFAKKKRSLDDLFSFSEMTSEMIRNKYEGCSKVKETLDTFEREKHLDVITCRMLMDRIN